MHLGSACYLIESTLNLLKLAALVVLKNLINDIAAGLPNTHGLRLLRGAGC